MSPTTLPPQASYGILQQTLCETAADQVIEQIRTLGYAVLDGGFSQQELQHFSKTFVNDTLAIHYADVHFELEKSLLEETSNYLHNQAQLVKM